MSHQKDLDLDASKRITSVKEIRYSTSMTSLTSLPQLQPMYQVQLQTHQTQQNTVYDEKGIQVEGNSKLFIQEQEQLIHNQKQIDQIKETNKSLKDYKLPLQSQTKTQQSQHQQHNQQTKPIKLQTNDNHASFKDMAFELLSKSSHLYLNSELVASSHLSQNQEFLSNTFKERTSKTFEVPTMMGNYKGQDTTIKNNNYNIYDPVSPIYRDFSTVSRKEVNMILQEQFQKDGTSTKKKDVILVTVTNEKNEPTSLPSANSKHHSNESYRSNSIEALPSAMASSNNSKFFLRQSRTNTFPVVLHQMLHFTDQSPNELHLTSSKTGKSAMICPKNILRWENHGRSFLILDKYKIVDYLFPIFFPYQNEYPSFQRQLNLYGFTRLTSKKNLIFETTNTTDGHSSCKNTSTANNPTPWQKKSVSSGSSILQGFPNPIQYYHEMFLRTRPDLCMNIVRSIAKRVPGAKGRSAYDQDSEPNLESFPPLLADQSFSTVFEPQLPEFGIGPFLASKSSSPDQSHLQKTMTEDINRRQRTETMNPFGHYPKQERKDPFSAIPESTKSLGYTFPLGKTFIPKISDPLHLEAVTFSHLDSSFLMTDEKVENNAQICNRNHNLKEKQNKKDNGSPSAGTTPTADNKTLKKSSSSSSIASSTNWSITRGRCSMNALDIQSDDYQNVFILSPTNKRDILYNGFEISFHSLIEQTSDMNSVICHEFCKQQQLSQNEQWQVPDNDGDVRHKPILPLHQHEQTYMQTNHQQNVTFSDNQQSTQKQTTNENIKQMIAMNKVPCDQHYNVNGDLRTYSQQHDKFAAQQYRTKEQQDQYECQNYVHNQLKPPIMENRISSQQKSEQAFEQYQLFEGPNPNHRSQNDFDSKIKLHDSFEISQRLSQSHDHLQLHQQIQQQQPQHHQHHQYHQQKKQLTQNLQNHHPSTHETYHLAQSLQSHLKSYRPQTIQVDSAINQEPKKVAQSADRSLLGSIEPDKLNCSILEPRSLTVMSTHSSMIHPISTATESLFLKGYGFEPLSNPMQQVTHNNFDEKLPSFFTNEQQSDCWSREGSSQSLDMVPMNPSKSKRRFSNRNDKELPQISSQPTLGQEGLLHNLDNKIITDLAGPTSLEVNLKRLKKEF